MTLTSDVRDQAEAAQPRKPHELSSARAATPARYDILSRSMVQPLHSLRLLHPGAALTLEHRLRCDHSHMAEPPSGTDPSVAVVAENPETVDGLAAYLLRSGVRSKGSCTVDQLAELASSAAAVVLFPDEFGPDEMVRAIQSLRRSQPMLFILLVTRDPHRFAPAIRGDGKSVAPVVLPKPSFGWTILDALREHVLDLADRA